MNELEKHLNFNDLNTEECILSKDGNLIISSMWLDLNQENAEFLAKELFKKELTNAEELSYNALFQIHFVLDKQTDKVDIFLDYFEDNSFDKELSTKLNDKLERDEFSLTKDVIEKCYKAVEEQYPEYIEAFDNSKNCTANLLNGGVSFHRTDMENFVSRHEAKDFWSKIHPEKDNKEDIDIELDER